jgi:UDP-glucose 4-epimerase
MENLQALYKGRTVLVTGAAGAIGSNLCKRLTQLGAHILAVDDLSSSEIWNLPTAKTIRFINADILDEPRMVSVFEQRPYVVFHLAGFFANENSVQHPERDLMVNGMGTLRMLVLARRFGVGTLVFASSSSIYGAAADRLDESVASIRLTSPYQISKRLGEQYCNFFAEYYGLRVVKARLFNSYGPGDAPGKYRSVIPNLIYLALKRQPLPITGTGDETRDFTYVEDIVEGLIASGVCESAVGKELNLCSGIETRVGELAERINCLTGNPAGVCFQPQRKWDEQKRRRGSYDLARKLLGYEPAIPLDTGLPQTVQWFRENWDNIESRSVLRPDVVTS